MKDTIDEGLCCSVSLLLFEIEYPTLMSDMSHVCGK